ncbi:hypothetical protein IP86_17435 [Rhodopseudomonas sp. AAP120]|uniref:OpgC domain-containing protein n=1 Tax=Rhodopseudomonas TaxID=1073 RepID=UPI000164BE5D|nr:MULTISPECIES: OpgC domain-containing protein [Rhodopseudomonas]ACE99651.1 conserved hypothetical protein [Rhodopseudomonas palustris TIE-1]KPF96196.1 hypothetical protein IP86_17435 [Rhodopseudomonas sp. AAP120]
MATGKDSDVKYNSPMSTSSSERDLRIDLFCGLSLWWILVDHVPESYLNHFTPENFGSATPQRYLLSGLASGVVYDGVARYSGLALACMRVFRRAAQIYIAQIVTLAFLLAEVSYFGARQASMLDHANLDVLLDRSAETTFQAILLRYSPVNRDPLLLMIVLHFGLLLILPLVMHAWQLALHGSAALYVCAHLFDWYLSAYPTGQLYFNPLNWQLLFVIGVWWGASRGTWQLVVLRSNALAALATLHLAFSLVTTLGWPIHSIEAYVPAWLSRLNYPVDKSNLDVLRLLHFASLALLCWRFLPSSSAIVRTREIRPSGAMRQTFARNLLRRRPAFLCCARRSEPGLEQPWGADFGQFGRARRDERYRVVACRNRTSCGWSSASAMSAQERQFA